ncbi:N-acetylglucosamine-6-phosphate deacetylase [Kutzneria viridogrisea]|uniref:N-acetylglucosamine-6-phosphate deacetylase n=2 Tax=Kutzneria TaxID=43356 RepID=W5WB40_9PSEU|nr:N-acetylglucosamine-6-phosphate deacetylase [Kutzneria albida]AHH95429.1 N-acetylglucosamine-6-phosphate deacetylase [Kutzneria albida DSM 43870]MBA8927212.1 N-acetylglucosamine-6-phosphate deacetylase [Kutzneria viridogrisea]
MYLLRNARLVLPGAVVDNGRITVDGEWITDVGAGAEGVQGPGVRTIDLDGSWIVPGFVDMHVHGGGGASYPGTTPEQARQVFEFHRNHGTTTAVASTVTMEVGELERGIACLAELVQDGLLAGIHLEGPFISRARCGAHDPALLREPEPHLVQRLLDRGRGAVRMVTLATELHGGLHAVRQLTDNGVIAALGHTDSSYEQARTAIGAGVTVATHLFNAMRGIHHREPGPITAMLEDEGVTVEVINDGHHLHDAAVELAFQAAGHHRVALITDAMSAAGAGDGSYELGPLAVRVVDGVARLADSEAIAGSTLTMDSAFRRAVLVNQIPIEHASAAASSTPARVLGIDHLVGSLSVGKRADLVVLDADLRVQAVMSAGRWVTEVPQAQPAVGR